MLDGALIADLILMWHVFLWSFSLVSISVGISYPILQSLQLSIFSFKVQGEPHLRCSPNSWDCFSSTCLSYLIIIIIIIIIIMIWWLPLLLWWNCRQLWVKRHHNKKSPSHHHQILRKILEHILPMASPVLSFSRATQDWWKTGDFRPGTWWS